MSEAGFLQQKPRSPRSLVVVIAAHATVLTALATAKMEVPTIKIFNPLRIEDIKVPPPPPKNAPEPLPNTDARPKTQIDVPESLIPTPTPNDEFAIEPLPKIPLYDPGPSGNAEVQRPADPPKPLPLPEPVRTEAQMDRRSELQPPYPPSEQRAGAEGSVMVRVAIGVDGRVKAVTLLKGSNEAFFRATEKQALRHWRFKPATVDGRPVASSKTLTVHFRLEA